MCMLDTKQSKNENGGVPADRTIGMILTVNSLILPNITVYTNLTKKPRVANQKHYFFTNYIFLINFL